MKKKIKDLTLQEVKKICDNHYPTCSSTKCPFVNSKFDCGEINLILDKTDFDEEIEVKEDEA